jgi:Arylsulfotransferase (ASST)
MPRALGIVLTLCLLAASCGDDDGGGGAPIGSGASDEEDTEQVALQRYATRPDLTPPVVDVIEKMDAVDAEGVPSSDRFLFLAPKRAGAQEAALIVDDQGETVWSAPAAEGDTVGDLRVQRYRGEPVLTWWEGRSEVGHGFGEFVIADSSYREMARVRAGNGLEGDFHEFRLTDEGTALLLAYRPEAADLSAVGGPVDGYELENYVQEVDVATGRVLMQWRAGDAVPVSDTFSEMTDEQDGSEDGPFDWFHVNSVAPGPGDTLLVSARNTHTIYGLDRATGALRWRLGGKGSDIDMDEGTDFAWQHDAQWLGGDRISLFDNGLAEASGGDGESRALILALDEAAGSATLVQEARHPDGVRAPTQGNTQVLADGGMVVGWGSEGRVSEFSAAGEIVFDAAFAPADSYRVYRFAWTGRPTAPPDVVARPAGDGIEVVASWNGATEVAQWRVFDGSTGADSDTATALATLPNDGFETTLTLEGVDAAAVVVEALDEAGTVLGVAGPVTVTD